jgi:hypothetical protein
MVDASQQYEGSVYLKTKEGTLKKHLMILIGNEIYFFRSRQDTQHKIMHCLTGTYIQDSDKNSDTESQGLISTSKKSDPATNNDNFGDYCKLKLVIPPNKSRVIFFKREEDRR